MSLTWLLQTVVGVSIEWAVFGLLAWVWGRRRLLPFLHKHGPKLLAMWQEDDR